jgi:hypothetical protein
MKETGRMARRKDVESTQTAMVPFMMETGRIT